MHHCLMSERASAPIGHTVAKGRPDRMELLTPMLEGTRRGGVGIRRAFLQKPLEGKKRGQLRAGPLSKLMRDESALDAYLLIHALASSSEPYDTWFPSVTWAQVTRLDAAAELTAAKSRWAKIATKLVKLGLIQRKPNGNKMNYVLLHESGDGTPYKRPKLLAHGSWFSLPHAYWTDGWDVKLTMAEKVMLLIALDQADGFRLPADRGPQWYGISETTVRRGLQGLVKHGILTRTDVMTADPKSPTGWKNVLYYNHVSPWTYEERKAAMLKGTPGSVTFTETTEEESP
jgi:predicted transcriptional regulator